MPLGTAGARIVLMVNINTKSKTVITFPILVWSSSHSLGSSLLSSLVLGISQYNHTWTLYGPIDVTEC